MTVVPNDTMSCTVSSSCNPFYKGPFVMRTCAILEAKETHMIAKEVTDSTPQLSVPLASIKVCLEYTIARGINPQFTYCSDLRASP